MTTVVFHKPTDGNAHNIFDAVGAFLAEGEPCSWHCGGWHPDNAPIRTPMSFRWQPQPYEGARLRVEVFNGNAALWRGVHLVALKWDGDLLFNSDMYISPTLALQAEHGVRGVPASGNGVWYGATNAVLDVLLIMWGRPAGARRESLLLRDYHYLKWS